MSLDKAIENHKEKLRPYRGAKSIDPSCRNHGGCDWCRENRLYQYKKECEKMRIETKYFADDGEEFATEQECREYELKMEDIFSGAVFLDGKFNAIENDFNAINDYAQYAAVVNADKAKRLFFAIRESGCDFPPLPVYRDGDIWQWDSVSYEWVEISVEIRALTAKIAAIQKAVAKL